MKKYISLCFLFSTVLFSCGLENFDNNLLANSTWELYGYKDDGLTNVLPLTDTLVFGTKSSYTFNGNQSTYQLIGLNNGNQTIRLVLNDSRFGNISGVVAVQSIKQGAILGESLSRSTDDKTWQLWFRKI